MSIFTDLGINVDNINKRNASYDRILPAMLIIDISGSVEKYSHKMITSILDLVKKLKKNDTHNNNVMLCIMVFNSSYKTILEFTRLGDIDEKLLEKNLKELHYHGRTHTGSAVMAAFDEIDSMRAAMRREGRKFYVPITFLVTDGNPNYTSSSDHQHEEKLLQESYETILKLQETKKGFFNVISVGDNVDPEIIAKLAGKGTPLSIDQTDIETLFEAVSDTIDSAANNMDTMDEETLNEKYDAFRQKISNYEEDE